MGMVTVTGVMSRLHVYASRFPFTKHLIINAARRQSRREQYNGMEINPRVAFMLPLAQEQQTPVEEEQPSPANVNKAKAAVEESVA